MNAWAVGGVVFVVVFFGLGVALVFLLFRSGTARAATSSGIPVDVGGVTVHVGGA